MLLFRTWSLSLIFWCLVFLVYVKNSVLLSATISLISLFYTLWILTIKAWRKLLMYTFFLFLCFSKLTWQLASLKLLWSWRLWTTTKARNWAELCWNRMVIGRDWYDFLLKREPWNQHGNSSGRWESIFIRSSYTTFRQIPKEYSILL